MQLEILPVHRQNSFYYKGKEYKAIGNFKFSGWSVPFSHAWRDNIASDTPQGYSYEEFQKIASQNNANAEIYQCEGRLLIPYSVFIAEYREETHAIM